MDEKKYTIDEIVMAQSMAIGILMSKNPKFYLFSDDLCQLAANSACLLEDHIDAVREELEERKRNKEE